jgi:hypothetical protein
MSASLEQLLWSDRGVQCASAEYVRFTWSGEDQKLLAA